MHDSHYFFHHVPDNLETGTYRIFEPEWKAQILDWFSQEDVPKEQKEEFIKDLTDFDCGCGDVYRYRAYFLAAEALAHFKDCSLGDAIVEQLLKWSYIYFGGKIYPKALTKAARAALEVTDRERVISAFVQLTHTTESRHTLREAALHLGKFDPGNKSAIAALVLLLQVTEHKDTIYKIIRSLEQIGSGSEIAIAALVHLMETTGDKYICRYAISSLREIGCGSPIAISALVKFLQVNRGDEICFAAIVSLWKIDPGNAAVTESLVHILENTQNRYFFSDAAGCLAEMAPGCQAAIAALSERLETDPDEWLRWRAADRLLEIDPTNQIATATLSQMLEPAQAEWERMRAAEILLRSDPGNKTAAATLSEVFETTQDEEIRWRLAERLLEIDPDSQTAVTTLSQLLETSDSQLMRLKAAERLAQSEDCRQKAITALFELAHSFIDEYQEYGLPDRLPAISILEKIDLTYQLTTEALFQVISATEDCTTLMFAAESLARIAPSNSLEKAKLDEVVPILVRFIQTFQEVEDTQFYSATSSLSYESCLLELADSLKALLQSDHLPQVVTALKDYAGEPFYKNSSYRYEAVLDILWHCAQKMTYPDFCKAWRE
ncbi:MAG: hypothetical protein KME26_11880 [Oscillatoria princeps RMCB-10]|jgi:HEAT repeat protein|nr:hypothetical protein [Oscillatoria princeps RMCB-10]